MKQSIFIFVFFIYNNLALSQQNDYGKVWVQGGGISFTTTFNANQILNQYLDTFYSPYFAGGHSNICDSTGNLILCSDGCNIYNHLAQHIDGGDTIVPLQYYIFNDGFIDYPQSSILLPMGNQIYYLITPTASDYEINTYWKNPNSGRALYDLLLYDVIDMNANNGAGKVTKRMQPLLQNVMLSKPQMMACKHGDGKSWWLLKQANDTNMVYKFLFTKDTILGPYVQGFPEPHFTKWDQQGQSMFSLDGTKYATVCRVSDQLFVADFDRCSGNLSNPHTYTIPQIWDNNPYDSTELDIHTVGLSFSANGRFIYVSKDYNIMQIDLQAAYPDSSWYHIAGLDTSWQVFQRYSSIYPGLDNKLYIGNWNGLSSEMSVINNPNAKGALADFCPRCLRFPKFHFSPNNIGGGVISPPCMPNYKLDATNPPCTVGVTELTVPKMVFEIFPNPTSGQITVHYQLDENEKGLIQITDMYGRVVKEVQLNSMLSTQKINMGNVANGIYFYRFLINGTQKATGKIVLTR